MHKDKKPRGNKNKSDSGFTKKHVALMVEGRTRSREKDKHKQGYVDKSPQTGGLRGSKTAAMKREPRKIGKKTLGRTPERGETSEICTKI